MSISGIGAGANGVTPGSNGDPLKGLAQNYETFLKLLTEQLKNQDPLQPQETSEFTNQLVQFSQVEQQIQTNKKLDSLAGVIQQGQASVALQYIGKTVELNSSGVPLTGQGTTISYDVAGDVESATLVITDAEGKVVTTRSVPTTQGRNAVFWDGRDVEGNPKPAGYYTANIQFRGGDEAAIAMSSRYAPFAGEPVTVAYDIGATVNRAVLVVRDATGRKVHEQTVPHAPGLQRVQWDGRSSDGRPVSTGYYDLSIEAPGAAVGAVRSSVLSRISGVDMSSGRTQIMVGPLPIPMENVRSISEAS